MYKALENSSHCSKKISTLTVGKFIEIRKEVFDDERIFDYSFIEIGKLFLSKILEINTEQSNFKDIRNEYIESSKNKEISELEIDFYKDICFKYLSLEKEPKETLFNSYRQVTKDLEEIKENILYIDNEIKKQELKKQNMDITYYLKQLNFYKEKNIIAKDEIINFLVKDIKNYAIEKSQKKSFSLYQIHNLFNRIMPYRFSKSLIPFPFHKNDYDVRELTPISNKFLNAAARAYPDIKNLYNDNKEEFFEFAKMYISEKINGEEDVITEITNLIETNHILNRRKDVLKTIFNHYKNEDYISVVNMLPLQIEGIFHDISIELGISESQSNKTAINELLKILDKNTSSFHYFEYYSFIFPITRNKVAHGKLIEDNFEHTAIMLILDLLPVCKFAVSEDIKINKILKLMKSIIENEKESELIEFIQYLDTDIPVFYNISSLKENILKKYSEDKFWDYVNKKIMEEDINSLEKKNLIKYIGILKKKNISYKKCKLFFDNKLK
ncbi:hypothetical protein [Aliarcobacter cryaerophilus]|uniref:hypothetical protein n=1 Tax=Aliarcobacter cryaerophilus TaxID=28198 RepID=UPI00082BFD67|nr:hypothetical protein [Aliarcobacter cryaerophilus]